jgi:hypothetical protein
LSNHVYVDIQVDEARRSKLSMLEIHKAWRKIMRIAKVEELRNDIVWLSAKHVHQVEGKDHTIATFQRTLDEAEAQHQNVQTKHFTMLDSLIDLHYMRTKVRSCYYFHSAGSLLLVL